MLKLAAALSLLIATVSCNTAQESALAKSYERQYRASYEETWRAVQQSIISYPLKVNNMDVGQIQTTPIRGTTQFKPPHLSKVSGTGQRYSLTINVMKVSARLTKVTILKDTVVHRDFISQPEEKISDGLEESVLLYRIGREIEVEKILVRESNKQGIKTQQ